MHPNGRGTAGRATTPVMLIIIGPLAAAHSHFAFPLIGLQDVPIEFCLAPLSLRLSNSIEATPFRLRSAQSVGTESCIEMQFPSPPDGGSSRSLFGVIVIEALS